MVWHEEGAYRWQDLRVPGGGKAGFTRLAPSKTGVDFTNAVDEDSAIANRHLLNGSGVALGDVDGDGRVDIWLNRIEGAGALFRNRGGMRFEDVTARSGLTVSGRHATGAALADVDGDGDLDLLVTALGGPNALYRNDGHGVFADATSQAGLASTLGSTTATLGDVDGDGDLDLYIASYKTVNALDLFSPAERAFDQVVTRVGDSAEVVPRFRKHYRARLMKAYGAVVRVQRADPDLFYLNDGHGTFARVPLAMSPRFLDEAGKPLAEEPDYFGLSARFHDVNGDGAPDLYVCNDFEDPDQFWLNDGAGNFRLVPRLALRTTSNSSMAVDFADIDRDGQEDFFVADMLSRDSYRRKTETPTHSPLPKLVGVIDDRSQMQRNTLYRNRGDGTFAQIAEVAGVEASGWSWAAQFLDVDLDGYEDLLIATGHTWDVMDSDTWERIRNAGSGADWRREITLFPRLPLRNEAFRNSGDLTFTPMKNGWGLGDEEAISHGMAAGDLDGDGDMDVVINRMGAPAGVYRNESPAGRVAVRLAGRAPNTRAVGATISVTGGRVPQSKEMSAGGGYLSSSDAEASFAASPGDSLTITVRWRDGGRSVVRDARANRLYEIRQPVGALGADSIARPRQDRDPLFEDATASLGHVHTDSPYDDYARQPLLPNRLSQLGPGVSWYDVDGDGDEDLLVGTGRGGTLGYFRNDRGRFSRVDLRAGVAAYDETTVLGLAAPAGGTAILVGQSSYEAASPDEALRVASVLRLDGSGVRRTAAPAVAGDTSSTGPMALADIDGDGDLDLFVGGRVLPGAYPVPASSRLLRSDAGRFVPDESAAKLFRSVGMISAALFSDQDGDGDPDLLLAPEWGPIRLFVNDGGTFSEHGAERGLGRFRSRWNGIASGDFDGDGRPDIVATSWGRGTTMRASEARPLELFFGNYDDNGSLDVVVAQRDDRIGGVAPLDPLSRLALAIPSVRMRTPTFADYASAGIAKVIGPSIARGARLEANTLDHTVFLNRGTSYEAVPLPSEAQLAPAFYAGAADVDGDGREDLFLSQNFFPTETGTPRFDAGRGLWLRGDGKGAFSPVAGQRSGVAVYGDQRGAALGDYDGDGRVDLVVTQNGAATRLFHNRGAVPGLRVRLVGGAGNPGAVGGAMRLVYADRSGPVREVQAGSGYWSQNGAVQVLGRDGSPVAVWVRWPGGAESTTPVPPGARELVIRQTIRPR